MTVEQWAHTDISLCYLSILHVDVYDQLAPTSAVIRDLDFTAFVLMTPQDSDFFTQETVHITH